MVLAALMSATLMFLSPSAADQAATKIEPLVEQAMNEGKIPSATVALVAGDRIVWAKGFGYSNLRSRTPADPETVYLIGSTFKAMSTFALLQQMEQGKFRLDDPVNRYMNGLAIRGEDPAHPITFRHLLTHTSGLPAAFGGHPVWGETVPSPLPDYLRRSLEVKRPPLERVEYSNLAFTLVAYLVEHLSGVPYKKYIQEQIFAPLQMTSTSFEPTPDMDERLAVPYAVEEKTGRQTPAARVKADVWPAGIVYGTVLDQANWLIANLNRGKFGDRQLLKPETHAQMLVRQYDKFARPMEYGYGNSTTGYGLTWIITERKGERFFAHSGSVAGYTAFLLGNASRKIGFAILTNGNRAHRHIAKLAEDALDLLAVDSR